MTPGSFRFNLSKSGIRRSAWPQRTPRRVAGGQTQLVLVHEPTSVGSTGKVT